MSISFQPYVHDAANDLWLIPYAARQDPDAFEINVSNANGDELLLAIGLDPSAEHPPMPIAAFSTLVTAALRRHLDQRSPNWKQSPTKRPA